MAIYTFETSCTACNGTGKFAAPKMVVPPLNVNLYPNPVSCPTCDGKKVERTSFDSLEALRDHVQGLIARV